MQATANWFHLYALPGLLRSAGHRLVLAAGIKHIWCILELLVHVASHESSDLSVESVGMPISSRTSSSQRYDPELQVHHRVPCSGKNRDGNIDLSTNIAYACSFLSVITTISGTILL
jgi:hypothetical protein